jgi:hypothetical protein
VARLVAGITGNQAIFFSRSENRYTTFTVSTAGNKQQ